MDDAAGPAGGVGLILVAAGSGTRLGAGMPKALVPLGHGTDAAPVVVHALRGALRCAALSHVVVVAPADPDGMAQLSAALDAAGLTPDRTSGGDGSPQESPDRTSRRDSSPQAAAVIAVVPGGAERSDSVAAGLAALPSEVGLVLVHDAARALMPAEVFDRVVHAVRGGHAAVTPALPVVDTVKQVRVRPGGQEVVTGTVDRSQLRAVQTPQGFLRETLERAHHEIEHAVTDDAGMVEALGGEVLVVAGDPRGMKITTPHDLEVARAWLAEADAGARPGSAPVTPTRGTGAPVLPDQRTATLVVLAGLPGVGKTTVGRELCRLLPAAHLRVDTIERGLVRGGVPEDELGPKGYAAAYALAADQLALGLSVVADMVNGNDVVRQAWEEVAASARVHVVRVLVECSDSATHRQRLEQRRPDISGHRLPRWSDVADREFEPWPQADLRVDTAAEAPQAVARRILDHLREASS